MKKRDLKADLGWIERAREKLWDSSSSYAEKKKLEHLMIEESFIGWPHAIERAIKAESIAWELVGVIDELRRQINECGLDGEMWDVYQKAKEVLGDGRE